MLLTTTHSIVVIIKFAPLLVVILVVIIGLDFIVNIVVCPLILAAIHCCTCTLHLLQSTTMCVSVRRIVALLGRDATVRLHTTLTTLLQRINSVVVLLDHVSRHCPQNITLLLVLTVRAILKIRVIRFLPTIVRRSIVGRFVLSTFLLF